MQNISYKELKTHFDTEKTLLEKNVKTLDMFKGLWVSRKDLIKKLIKKNDVSSELAIINRAELRLISLIENAWPSQKEELKIIINTSPEELKEKYTKMSEFANSWFSVIGVHKHFLEMEKEAIPTFTKSRKSRKNYFSGLESTLKIYSDILKTYDEEKIIGNEILSVAHKKVSNFPSKTIASFKYGWYRIFVATMLGKLMFGDSLPGGTFEAFILWSMHVNVAGTIVSYIDMKISTANRLKDIAEDLIYLIKPSTELIERLKPSFSTSR